MDAPTVVAVLVAGAVALKILVDLTVRHLAMERIRLKNEADAAAFEAAAKLMSEPSPTAAGAGGTGRRTAP